MWSRSQTLEATTKNLITLLTHLHATKKMKPREKVKEPGLRSVLRAPIVNSCSHANNDAIKV
jgi:hypothetical protein